MSWERSSIRMNKRSECSNRNVIDDYFNVNTQELEIIIVNVSRINFYKLAKNHRGSFCFRVPRIGRGKGLKYQKGESHRYKGKERLEVCKQTSFGSVLWDYVINQVTLMGGRTINCSFLPPLMKVDGLGPRVCFWATLQTLVWQS